MSSWQRSATAVPSGLILRHAWPSERKRVHAVPCRLGVLNRLDGSQCTLQGIDNADLVARADNMIDNSKKIGVPEITSGSAFSKGNDKVNTLFISYVFNTKHGLEELTKEEYEAVGLIDDDIEASKEERMFTRWINTLGIDDRSVRLSRKK